MNLNQSKSARQEEAIEKWLANKGVGTFNWVTGMGKTVASVKIISKVFNKIEAHVLKTYERAKKDKNFLIACVQQLKIAIVVPSTTLKDQWTTILEKEFPNYKECFIINTMHSFSEAKNAVQVYLAIFDEIHLYLENSYFSLFTNIQSKFKLGLSATLFKDSKFIQDTCPIIDVITEEEAMLNNWVSVHQQINFLVPLTASENTTYRYETAFIAKFMPLFNYRNNNYFDIIKQCTTDLDLCELISRFHGFKYEKSKHKLDNELKSNANITFDQLSSTDIKRVAILLTSSIAYRQKILFESYYKRWSMVNFIKEYPDRTYIIFVQFIKDVESVISYLNAHGLKAAPFHSQLKDVPLYVLPNGTLTSIKTKNCKIETYKSGQKAGQEKTYGTPKIKEAILNDMRAGKYNIMVSNTAGDTGVDIPNLDTSINLCYTGNPTQHHQRKGRVIRQQEDKKALVINFACENTTEIKKLEEGQSHTTNKITVVKSLNELKTSIVDYF